ncbi:hypothetical protein N7G274_009391 [Stereocaulon virgatum]|uniref:Exosome complex protein n=1 Tax=Stereocaulon virgatum TaxID=373712 RepID=A0ABR3ZY53_9LECA
MEATDLVPMIEQLDDNIDDLEEALEPLMKATLSDTAAKLPLLDKAQLYVLVAYAIESILFSYLRLNGVNAKEHPVFRELTRLKQYFEKIKAAESAGSNPTTKLDKAAAGRFIKHALARNEKYDLQRAEQQAKEKAAANIRFQQLAKTSELGYKTGAESHPNPSSAGSGSASPEPVGSQLRSEGRIEHIMDQYTTAEDSVSKARKRKRKSQIKEALQDTIILDGKSKEERKREKKEKKARKKRKSLETTE